MNEDALPPTQKGRTYELKAMAIRDFAGLKEDDQPLNPFELARYARLVVVPFAEIEQFLSPQTREYLLNEGKNVWSGGVCSKSLPTGERLIILNPTHSRARQNATLMEEICHIFLGHKPSKIHANSKDDLREYSFEVEEEAYSVGAAALVPFSSLKRMINKGLSSQQIANHFKVSRELVEYRIKVTGLWKRYQEMKED
ncbi:MAG: ImmA/IrrE family metallo-endopeptidase [Pyrinomonadaceae bacterium]|nr:ImmA/IrrE family metallo-endopeptidase [Pyrinomonadaceae bacterium]MCX7640714.1 ImmA/IrrE family metallo-endopeptidase [Pyrinomonadaceae bacterium]MDW8305318.1 ImmA/IrrE family metallo-endopeptidase [Acidobacteriota bacterium]